MDYWKHSLLSRKKFGGNAEDYLDIHQFLDSSKLFYFHFRHRILIHNTYGIQLCIRRFGETRTNAAGKVLLVRDIAAEHCKEDLMGAVPTLHQWFKDIDPVLNDLVQPVIPIDPQLKSFVLEPLFMSGIPSTLLITHSDFGIYLVKEFLGADHALEWARLLQETPPVQKLLQHVHLRERWQFTPDLKQLEDIR